MENTLLKYEDKKNILNCTKKCETFYNNQNDSMSIEHIKYAEMQETDNPPTIALIKNDNFEKKKIDNKKINIDSLKSNEKIFQLDKIEDTNRTNLHQNIELNKTIKKDFNDLINKEPKSDQILLNNKITAHNNNNEDEKICKNTENNKKNNNETEIYSCVKQEECEINFTKKNIDNMLIEISKSQKTHEKDNNYDEKIENTNNDKNYKLIKKFNEDYPIKEIDEKNKIITNDEKHVKNEKKKNLNNIFYISENSDNLKTKDSDVYIKDDNKSKDLLQKPHENIELNKINDNKISDEIVFDNLNTLSSENIVNNNSNTQFKNYKNTKNINKRNKSEPDLSKTAESENLKDKQKNNQLDEEKIKKYIKLVSNIPHLIDKKESLNKSKNEKKEISYKYPLSTYQQKKLLLLQSSKINESKQTEKSDKKISDNNDIDKKQMEKMPLNTSEKLIGEQFFINSNTIKFQKNSLIELEDKQNLTIDCTNNIFKKDYYQNEANATKFGIQKTKTIDLVKSKSYDDLKLENKEITNLNFDIVNKSVGSKINSTLSIKDKNYELNKKLINLNYNDDQLYNEQLEKKNITEISYFEGNNTSFENENDAHNKYHLQIVEEVTKFTPNILNSINKSQEYKKINFETDYDLMEINISKKNKHQLDIKNFHKQSENEVLNKKNDFIIQKLLDKNEDKNLFEPAETSDLSLMLSPKSFKTIATKDTVISQKNYSILFNKSNNTSNIDLIKINQYSKDDNKCNQTRSLYDKKHYDEFNFEYSDIQHSSILLNNDNNNEKKIKIELENNKKKLESNNTVKINKSKSIENSKYECDNDKLNYKTKINQIEKLSDDLTCKSLDISSNIIEFQKDHTIKLLPDDNSQYLSKKILEQMQIKNLQTKCENDLDLTEHIVQLNPFNLEKKTFEINSNENKTNEVLFSKQSTIVESKSIEFNLIKHESKIKADEKEIFQKTEETHEKSEIEKNVKKKNLKHDNLSEYKNLLLTNLFENKNKTNTKKQINDIEQLDLFEEKADKNDIIHSTNTFQIINKTEDVCDNNLNREKLEIFDKFKSKNNTDSLSQNNLKIQENFNLSKQVEYINTNNTLDIDQKAKEIVLNILQNLQNENTNNDKYLKENSIETNEENLKFLKQDKNDIISKNICDTNLLTYIKQFRPKSPIPPSDLNKANNINNSEISTALLSYDENFINDFIESPNIPTIDRIIDSPPLLETELELLHNNKIIKKNITKEKNINSIYEDKTQSKSDSSSPLSLLSLKLYSTHEDAALVKTTINSDNISSEGSFKEFEQFEQEINIKQSNRIKSVGGSPIKYIGEIVSEELLHGIATSTGSISSLTEFENLEREIMHISSNNNEHLITEDDIMILSDIREESEEIDEIKDAKKTIIENIQSANNDINDDSLAEENQNKKINLSNDKETTYCVLQDVMLCSVDSLELGIKHDQIIMNTSIDSLEPAYYIEDTIKIKTQNADENDEDSLTELPISQSKQLNRNVELICTNSKFEKNKQNIENDSKETVSKLKLTNKF